MQTAESGGLTWLYPSKGCAGSGWAERLGRPAGSGKPGQIPAGVGDNISRGDGTRLGHWIWDPRLDLVA